MQRGLIDKRDPQQKVSSNREWENREMAVLWPKYMAGAKKILNMCQLEL